MLGDLKGVIGLIQNLKTADHGTEIQELLLGTSVDLQFQLFDVLHHFEHGTVVVIGRHNKTINGGLPYSTSRIVDNPLKGFFILRIQDETQIGQYILDLFTLIKTQPAVNAVGNVLFTQGVFHST